jgi:hypothetical protein
MKRLEILFGVIVAALAVFVGYEARGARIHEQAGGGNVTASTIGGAVSKSAKHEAAPETPVVSRPANDAERNRDDIKRRISEYGAATYIGEIITVRDSILTHWPDRRLQPLRIWIQPASDLPHFQRSFVPLVREAFEDWAGTGIPVSFTFVVDSASAEVHVTWIDKFSEQISGKTLWAHDDDGWIVEGNILLALHHNSGEPLDANAVRAIALHEVGHLVGLDHTTDPTNIMTPKVRVKELSAADRATVRLLYELPPGRIGRSISK